MWISQNYAKPDEMQESVQELHVSFKSGQIGYLILINKSMRFSQSLLGVQAGVDMYGKNQISADGDILRITKVRAML